MDFLPVEPFCAPSLTELLAATVAEEAITESSIGSRGVFPGPLFLAMPPVELEWAQRIEIATKLNQEACDYDELLRVCGGSQFTPYHERFLFGSVADHLADRFGTKGSPISLSTACASGASAIQLGIEAIRRGETDAALCIASDGSINAESLVRFSLLSALSTSNDPPQGAAKPFSKNRDGFVMAEGAGALVLESLESAQARGAKILGVMEGAGEMAEFLPPDAFQSGRQADRRLHPQRIDGRRADARRHRLREPARHRHLRKRQDGVHRDDGRVWRAFQANPDLVQQVHGGPYALGRRSGRGGVQLAHA